MSNKRTFLREVKYLGYDITYLVAQGKEESLHNIFVHIGKEDLVEYLKSNHGDMISDIYTDTLSRNLKYVPSYVMNRAVSQIGKCDYDHDGLKVLLEFLAIIGVETFKNPNFDPKQIKAEANGSNLL